MGKQIVQTEIFIYQTDVLIGLRHWWSCINPEFILFRVPFVWMLYRQVTWAYRGGRAECDCSPGQRCCDPLSKFHICGATVLRFNLSSLPRAGFHQVCLKDSQRVTAFR